MMFLTRKVGENTWHSADAAPYPDEAALETLLHQSPGLLPGSASAAMAIVRRLQISAATEADLVGVDPSGRITLVECKLRRNREIRREVVGQVFAYAAALWKLPYDRFDQTFTRAGGTSLV